MTELCHCGEPTYRKRRTLCETCVLPFQESSLAFSARMKDLGLSERTIVLADYDFHRITIQAHNAKTLVQTVAGQVLIKAMGVEGSRLDELGRRIPLGDLTIVPRDIYYARKFAELCTRCGDQPRLGKPEIACFKHKRRRKKVVRADGRLRLSITVDDFIWDLIREEKSQTGVHLQLIAGLKIEASINHSLRKENLPW